MSRFVYSLFTVMAQPWLRGKLARRAKAEPLYAQNVPERFGHYQAPAGQGFVWIHAVSLGETRAAAILLAQLRAQSPNLRLLLTNATATGRAEGEKLLRPGDVQVWQPWDTPAAVKRFLSHFKPCVGVLMETEVWPNLIAGCKVMNVPLVVANARLSDKSLRQARRLACLAKPAYKNLTAVWAQTQVDAQRLTQLGAPVKGVFGNLKFDASPDAGQLAAGRRWALGGKPVVMFASSREGEEAMLLAEIKKHEQAVQWLIVPRHPQRFSEVQALCEQNGLSVSRRSSWSQTPEPADIWLGDSLGEMALYYGLSQVALLGGSFAPLGGQNLIEAAACACPVVMGPHTFNFEQAAQLALAAGAAIEVTDIAQGIEKAVVLARSSTAHQAAVAASLQFAQEHRGAALKTSQAVLSESGLTTINA